MPLPQWILIGILIVSTTLYITQWLSVELTSVLVIVALLVTGVLGPNDALAGFSSSATITVAAMFVISAGLVRTGASCCHRPDCQGVRRATRGACC